MLTVGIALLSILVLSPLSAQDAAGISPGSASLGLPVFSADARQGDAQLIWIPRLEASEGFFGEAILSGPTGAVIQRTAAFHMTDARKTDWDVCALAIPMNAPPGLYTIELRGVRGVSVWSFVHVLPVRARNFISEDIPLNSDLTAIRTEATARKEEEARSYAEVLGRVDSEGTWLDGPFVRPVASERRTSYFGDKRRYIYATGGTANGVHAGIDFAAPTGTPVKAAGRGRVVLASRRETTGNTVILEHLPGIYTIYMHMDSLAVTKGAVVERSGALGTVGSTGLATGPHLHWELRVRGEACDPESPALSSLLPEGLTPAVGPAPGPVPLAGPALTP